MISFLLLELSESKKRGVMFKKDNATYRFCLPFLKKKCDIIIFNVFKCLKMKLQGGGASKFELQSLNQVKIGGQPAFVFDLNELALQGCPVTAVV